MARSSPVERSADADRALAAQLDAADPLASFLDRFEPLPAGTVYLDGNSLGRPPKQARAALEDLQDRQWRRRLIRSWNEGWMELPHELGDRLGAHLLAAGAGQTVVADSTTVCFYKLASAALAARPDATRIIADANDFPTDRYILESLAEQHDRTITWIRSPADGGPQPDQIQNALTQDQTALVALSHVSYRSAQIADMHAITQLAHDHGALALWDLSHSAGAVPIALDADDVDLAVGCTYKYLNGGPGAPAFLYVNRRHHDTLRQPIWGWLGRRDPFAMAPGYEPSAGIGQMLSGTPPILGLVAARAGIELSIEATIDAIRAKSTRLTAYAIELADRRLAPLDVTVGSPRDATTRGGHVALTHPDARTFTQRLAERKVIVDFREPDIIRIGLSPLTTRFADVHAGVSKLAKLLETGG